MLDKVQKNLNTLSGMLDPIVMTHVSCKELMANATHQAKIWSASETSDVIQHPLLERCKLQMCKVSALTLHWTTEKSLWIENFGSATQA